MRRFLARFSEPVSSVRAPSWADFITTTRELKFSVHTIGAKAPYPGFIEPALATSVDKVPGGERWLHEIKFDGYRYLNPREVFERKYRPEGARVGFAANREVAGFLRDVQDRVLNRCEGIEYAVVVYGTYGGKFFVESTVSGVETLGVLDIGHRTMLDAIVKPIE